MNKDPNAAQTSDSLGLYIYELHRKLMGSLRGIRTNAKTTYTLKKMAAEFPLFIFQYLVMNLQPPSLEQLTTMYLIFSVT